MMTREQRLLAIIRGFVEDYDNTGCDGCGVVSEVVYAEAQRVLETFSTSDTKTDNETTTARSGAKWVDPYESIEYVGERPVSLNLVKASNDPIDW